MAKKQFVVVFPLKHDGQKYKKGDKVTMEAADAADLVARGTLKEGRFENEPNAGMPEPVKGETGGSEQPAQQLTADPGTQTNAADQVV